MTVFLRVTILFFEEEYVRTSMPPIRSKNPFHKNFQDEVEADDKLQFD